MTKTTYTLTCLSPVHVGTGRQFNQFEGVYQDGRWRLIDLDRVLARGVDASALARSMGVRDFFWVTWLRQQNISPSDVEAYALPCPQDPEATPVREAMKDVYGQPYLPGTSVKGAVRTAILWSLLRGSVSNYTTTVQRLLQSERKREWLAQPLERDVLGRDPNHDLMRAIHVGDSAPTGMEQLAVGLVWTYTLRGSRLVEKREAEGEYKTFAEWLVPGASLRMDFCVDDYLFTERANGELRFQGSKEQAVRQLAQTCNAYARSLITTEKAFYGRYGPDALQGLYADLETTLSGLPEGAFLLNVGWGGGWEVKTVGDLIRKAVGQQDFEQLRRRYGLGQNPRTQQIAPNAPFPKTRRIAYEGGAPMWAMGWVKVEPLKEER